MRSSQYLLKITFSYFLINYIRKFVSKQGYNTLICLFGCEVTDKLFLYASRCWLGEYLRQKYLYNPNLKEIMSIYDLSFKKEVLTEKAVDVIGDIMRYMYHNEIDANDNSNPVVPLFLLIYKVKENILAATNEEELKKIEGKIEFAKEYFQKLSVANG